MRWATWPKVSRSSYKRTHAHRHITSVQVPPQQTRAGTGSLPVRDAFRGLTLSLVRIERSVKNLAKCLTCSGLYVTSEWMTIAHTARPLSVIEENHAALAEYAGVQRTRIGQFLVLAATCISAIDRVQETPSRWE